MATAMLSSVTPPVAAPAAQAATASAAGTEVNATPLADWYNSYTSANAGTTPAAPAAAATAAPGAAPTAPAAPPTPSAANPNVSTNQTVQGQLANVLDSNNPLMQRAETRAKQGMNQRGLLNSTMALQAGQAALYDAALPIAQQDANTYKDVGMQQAGLQQQTNLQTSDIQNQKDLQQANAQLQTSLQAADSATKMQLAEIENKWRTQIQTSASMANSYQQLTDGITRIMMDPELDGPSKQAAIGNLTTLYNNTLTMQSTLTGLNLGPLLNMSDIAPVAGGGAAAPGTAPGAEPGTPGGPVYDPNQG